MKNDHIRELELQFIGRGEVKGDLFEQLQFNGTLYLYRRTAPTGRVCYEVFKRKVHPTRGHVRYPHSNAFGPWAKCVCSYDEAMHYFNNGLG